MAFNWFKVTTLSGKTAYVNADECALVRPPSGNSEGGPAAQTAIQMTSGHVLFVRENVDAVMAALIGEEKPPTA